MRGTHYWHLTSSRVDAPTQRTYRHATRYHRLAVDDVRHAACKFEPFPAAIDHGLCSPRQPLVVRLWRPRHLHFWVAVTVARREPFPLLGAEVWWILDDIVPAVRTLVALEWDIDQRCVARLTVVGNVRCWHLLNSYVSYAAAEFVGG